MSDFSQKIVSELKKINIKITKERKELIKLILSISDHFCLNDLLNRANQSGGSVSRASIYRNLPILKRIGFIRQFDTHESKHSYEVMREKNHHEHLLCIECNDTYEFDDSNLNGFFNNIYEKYGFVPKSHKLQLCGICTNCQSSNNDTMSTTTLCDLKPGESGQIVGISIKGALKKRLLEMGLTKGKSVQIIKIAPLGDPIEIKIRGYELSLRKEEATQILINKQ